METPSLVIVGAPHFFSSTTLRPFGPRVTLTASARVFMPRSRPRRASSLKEMILAIWVVPPGHGWFVEPSPAPATDEPPRDAPCAPARRPSLGRAVLALTRTECQKCQDND